MSARPTGRAETLLGLAALAGAAGFLVARLAPAVGSKPLVEDEAVAGLVSVRPLGEVVDTVLTERGGSPLHFVLAHFALVADTSPDALRWLSVVFALAAAVTLRSTLPAGSPVPIAGGAAAIIVATSTVLGVYGSFGRMYALLAAAAALALDLFVVALRRRTVGAALAAAATSALLPAVHPYGAILLAAEGLVAAVLWRGRGIRRAAPVIAVGLLSVPFVVANLRLAERYSVGVGDGERLASPGRAWSQLTRALGSFAGGHGPLVVVFVLLAAVGLVLVARREPSLGLLAAIVFVTPPILLAVATTEADPALSPRHLVFLLPVWAALVGVAVGRLGERGVLVSTVALGAARRPGGGSARRRRLGPARPPRRHPRRGTKGLGAGWRPRPSRLQNSSVGGCGRATSCFPTRLSSSPRCQSQRGRRRFRPSRRRSFVVQSIACQREPGALFVAVPSDYPIAVRRALGGARPWCRRAGVPGRLARRTGRRAVQPTPEPC